MQLIFTTRAAADQYAVLLTGYARALNDVTSYWRRGLVPRVVVDEMSARLLEMTNELKDALRALESQEVAA